MDPKKGRISWLRWYTGCGRVVAHRCQKSPPSSGRSIRGGRPRSFGWAARPAQEMPSAGRQSTDIVMKKLPSDVDVANVAGAIAVIGMAGRFPGSRNLDEFRRNLEAGVESITVLSAANCWRRASIRNCWPILATSKPSPCSKTWTCSTRPFRVFAREAAIMDPQQRLFLECAWEALEDAGTCRQRGRLGHRRVLRGGRDHEHVPAIGHPLHSATHRHDGQLPARRERQGLPEHPRLVQA